MQSPEPLSFPRELLRQAAWAVQYSLNSKTTLVLHTVTQGLVPECRPANDKSTFTVFLDRRRPSVTSTLP